MKLVMDNPVMSFLMKSKKRKNGMQKIMLEYAGLLIIDIYVKKCIN